jgi:hypothetical protein
MFLCLSIFFQESQVRTERQNLAELKAKLDHAEKWVETHLPAK